MGTARQGTDQERNYEGQYIALDPKGGNAVIASGTKSSCVAEEARRVGVEVPVIVYVPKKDSTYLY